MMPEREIVPARGPSASSHRLLLAAAATALSCSAASAEEWKTDFLLYLFLPWSDFGVQTAGGASLETSLDPGDMIEALNMGLMFAGDTHKGKVSLLYDIFYSDLEFDGTLSAPLPVAVQNDSRLLLASFGVGYDLQRTDTGFAQVFGGARYVKIENTVTLTGTGALAPVVGISRDEDYLEPLIGVRGKTRVGDRTTFGGYVNVGGFGVGSELTLDSYLGLDYALNDRMSATAGVRYLSIDYEAANADLDVDMYGPVLGLAWRF